MPALARPSGKRVTETGRSRRSGGISTVPRPARTFSPWLRCGIRVRYPGAVRLHRAELVRVGAGALVPVQRGDRFVVLAGQLEVEDVDVLPDPGRGDRLGEDDVAALDVPAQHDLGRCLACRLGDRDDDRIAEQVTAARQR